MVKEVNGELWNIASVLKWYLHKFGHSNLFTLDLLVWRNLINVKSNVLLTFTLVSFNSVVAWICVTEHVRNRFYIKAHFLFFSWWTLWLPLVTLNHFKDVQKVIFLPSHYLIKFPRVWRCVFFVTYKRGFVDTLLNFVACSYLCLR